MSDDTLIIDNNIKRTGGTIRIKKSYFQDWVFEWLPFIYAVLNAVIRIVNNNSLLLRLCLCSLIIAGVYGLISVFIKKYTKVLMYILFTSVSWLFCLLLKDGGIYEVDRFIYSIMYMGMAIILLRHVGSVFKFRVLYFIVAIYLMVKIIYLKVPIRGFMLDESSYNFISVICLFYLALLGIMKYKNNEKLSLLEIACFVIITFVAYGRGGIVAAVVLLAGYIYLQIVENKRKYLIWLIIAAAIVVFIIYGNQIMGYLVDHYLGKFVSHGFDNNGRLDIWSGFLQNCLESPTTFLFGSDPSEVAKEGNLHNSILQMYASFGIVFMLVNLYLIAKATLYYLKSGERWLVLVFTVVFVRSLTDMVIFRGYCEIIYYFYLFNYLSRTHNAFLKNKPRRQSQRNENRMMKGEHGRVMDLSCKSES